MSHLCFAKFNQVSLYSDGGGGGGGHIYGALIFGMLIIIIIINLFRVDEYKNLQ